MNSESTKYISRTIAFEEKQCLNFRARKCCYHFQDDLVNVTEFSGSSFTVLHENRKHVISSFFLVPIKVIYLLIIVMIETYIRHSRKGHILIYFIILMRKCMLLARISSCLFVWYSDTIKITMLGKII